ncbi:MAG: c-type cytochrome [Rubripirellula sp.]
MSEAHDPDNDRQYDGIELEHHPAPFWFKWLFAAVIPFAPTYFVYYHGGAEGRTLADQHDQELATIMQARFAEIGELKMDRENVVKFLYEESWLPVGKVVFRKNCASCHGKDGGGLIGPNLCDESFKNINQIEDILRVVKVGANAGAMPAWQDRLLPNEIVLVSSYIASLRGTTPATSKAPEGKAIAPWPDAPEPQTASESEAEPSASP